MKTEMLYSTDGEMFRCSELSEAVNNRADDFFGQDVPLPLRFVVYEAEFTKEPASYYMPSDFIEQMNERAYDYLGEESIGDGLFAQFEYDEKALNKELAAALDAVFTKHNMQPTAMIGCNDKTEHQIEWSGPDDWKVIMPTPVME